MATYGEAGAQQGDRELIAQVTAHLSRMRDFRRSYDSQRALFYKQYLSYREQPYFPDAITRRSNTFVGYPWSNVETITARTLSAFFDFEEWFEVRPRGEQDARAAEQMQKVLRQMLVQAGFTKAFEDLVRNILIYGHAGMKVEWDWGVDVGTFPQPVFAQDENGQPVIGPDGQPIVQEFEAAPRPVPRQRPKFTALDVYDTLIDPDGGMIAHLSDRTWGQLRTEAAVNPELYAPEAMQLLAQRLAGQKDADNCIIRLAEHWDEVSGTCTLLTFNDPDAIAWKDRRASYRQGGGYSVFRRKLYAGEPVALWHGPNQFAHARAPILHTSYVRVPNEIYGIGAIEPISNLTESLNVFVNMITDNWNLNINKRYAYDTGAEIDHESLNRLNVPGGKVGVAGDPSKAIVPMPFFTPSPGDYQIIDLYQRILEMTSGVSDFYAKGVGAPTGNSTAFGINQIIGESNHRFKLFIRNLELYVLQPALRMCASLIQQYVKDDLEILITDEQAAIPKWETVRPESLIGSFDFDLVASNYVTNKVVRQRNLLAFVNLVGESPYWNEYEALKELAKVFEIKNIQRLLKSPQQVAQEQQAALEQQIKLQELTAQQEHRRDAERIVLQGAVNTEAKARLAKAKPQVGGKSAGGRVGRPPRAQFEGKIPGAGLTSVIRGLAQNMGANALGLEGTEGGAE